ncbi:uncharacterized protein PHALS_14752 [Plasmopara halstedii]|uniref:Uncharacterized protein n=1 Tax=Plasmopara halstedii TaxID=4781 RepID=A0A0P1AQP6_PLAHL|nr:uncharacterized protein PHALS_14752 [Plasmopara halstedii]CEG43898.1 hypothetical protein PHALS_14752 [Plasmopara halstedii]|eukprot:XP_024580267.1 hypothetical protein PHALS_14752 [Plasmopara halstedii]
MSKISNTLTDKKMFSDAVTLVEYDEDWARIQQESRIESIEFRWDRGGHERRSQVPEANTSEQNRPESNCGESGLADEKLDRCGTCKLKPTEFG